MDATTGIKGHYMVSDLLEVQSLNGGLDWHRHKDQHTHAERVFNPLDHPTWDGKTNKMEKTCFLGTDNY